jgi:tRNA-dihydrouridine synthase
MSGRITVKVRKGISKDPRYSYYPEWFLEIEGEDGTKTTVSPTFEEVANILIEILKHEKKVDLTRKRKPNFEKYKNYLLQKINEAKNIKVIFGKENGIYLNQKPNNQ